jgi:hypothetical protein
MKWLARAWFPIAVLALIVLALPGLALFIFSIAGMENEVNEYLESRYRMSYHLALPMWAAGILLAIPFLLILLYFLKLKRKPLSVPSTFLWKKSIEDLHVNSLFQWLRKNILLFLQLLAVLGLIYAILAPRFFAKAGQGRRFVILVDNSASMSATDIVPNRLDDAKQKALAEIDQAGDSDAGMVIAFNSAAEIRQSFTTNKQLLRQAIRGIEPTQRPTRIEEALALADSLANPTRSTEDTAARPDNSPRVYVPTEGVETAVHLFSDGRFPDAPNFAVGNLRVQFHAIGQAGPDVDNVGIVGMSASRDEYDPSRLFVTVRVLNYRPRPSDTRVELAISIPGQSDKFYEKAAQIPKRIVEKLPPAKEGEEPPPPKDFPGEALVSFEVPDVSDAEEVTIRARLAQHKDIFAIDDEGILVVGVVRKARVLIVGPPNAVLDAFFDDDATKMVCEVAKLPKDQLNGAAYALARNGSYDLVIFDRCAPAREDDMPAANTLFIGRPPPPWRPVGERQPDGLTVERVDNPAVKGWVNQHGLLRYLVGLHEVGIFEAYRIGGTPARTPRLMESDRDMLLLFTLNRGPHLDAVLTFPILTDTGDWNTNWPLLPSFPLFLRNVVYTLGNVRDANSEENTQPGEVKSLRPGPGIDKIKVTPPGEPPITLDRGIRADFSFAGTGRVGLYSAAWEGGGRKFAVNLFDSDESNLQPRDGIQLGAVTVAAGQPDKRPRDLWRWLVLAALGVVLVEWYIYNKRMYV